MARNKMGNEKATLTTHRVTVDLSPNDFEKLAELAYRRNITKREVILKALKLAYVLLQLEPEETIVIRKGNEEFHLLIT